jgi:ribosomal protein L7/L12
VENKKEKIMVDEYEMIQLRARIAELEARVEYLFNRLNIESIENTQNIDSKIVELVKQGNKIEAIKVYRAMYNVGLKEAKDAVDQLG